MCYLSASVFFSPSFSHFLYISIIIIIIEWSISAKYHMSRMKQLLVSGVGIDDKNDEISATYNHWRLCAGTHRFMMMTRDTAHTKLPMRLCKGARIKISFFDQYKNGIDVVENKTNNGFSCLLFFFFTCSLSLVLNLKTQQNHPS